MTKQVVPLPAANDYVALVRTRLRDLTGSDAIVGPAVANPGAAEQSDGEKAAALLKAGLESFAKDGRLSSAIKNAYFFKRQFYLTHFVPLLYAPPALSPAPAEGDSPNRARRRQTERAMLQNRFVEALKADKLPVAPPPPPASSRPSAAAEGDSGACGRGAPADWGATLLTLPAHAASRNAAGLGAALSALHAQLMPTSAAAGEPSEALRAAGGAAALLRQLLQSFAQCVHAAGAGGGGGSGGAPCTWAGPWVELLLWRPQRAVPALHSALWGWVRLAVAGVAGAHERPLALLLLHLGAAQASRAREREERWVGWGSWVGRWAHGRGMGRCMDRCISACMCMSHVHVHGITCMGSCICMYACMPGGRGRGCAPTPFPSTAQRAHDAAAGRAPAACATCDAHMRAVLRGGRARGGCDLEALLAQLPLGGGASRAWSMRLGVQLLELAAADFSGVDTGHAPAAAWAAAAEASGAAARPELPTHAACWLPPSLLHLLHWLAQRTATEPSGAEAEAEKRAAEHLRRCLLQPGAAQLCERIGETPALLTRRWTALAEMESDELHGHESENV